MKTSFLILNFIFFTLNTFAQNNVFKNHILQISNTSRNQSAQLRTEVAKVSLDSVVSIGYQKITYVYDANAFCILESRYSWNTKNSKWIFSGKSEFTNDQKGNILFEFVSRWNDTTSAWINSYKQEYAYDVNGNQTLNVSYYWDKSTINWIGSNKAVYSYDLKNNVIVDSKYTWNNLTNQWEGFTKDTYTYDSYGNVSTFRFSLWDINTKDWSTSPSYPYTFLNSLNSNNKLVSFIETYFTKNISKEENSYDSNGNRTLKINYSGDITSNLWLPRTKQETIFDAEGNINLDANYSWDSTAKRWEGTYKIVYEFDNTILASNLATTISGRDFKNKITRVSYYIWSNGSWLDDSNYKFYYSNDPTGIEDQFFITSQKNVVRICNQLGMEVKPEQVTSGFYIYQYSDGSTRKVMRQE